jgi:hypothetical protein
LTEDQDLLASGKSQFLERVAPVSIVGIDDGVGRELYVPLYPLALGGRNDLAVSLEGNRCLGTVGDPFDRGIPGCTSAGTSSG